MRRPSKSIWRQLKCVTRSIRCGRLPIDKLRAPRLSASRAGAVTEFGREHRPPRTQDVPSFPTVSLFPHTVPDLHSPHPVRQLAITSLNARIASFLQTGAGGEAHVSP